MNVAMPESVQSCFELSIFVNNYVTRLITGFDAILTSRQTGLK